jgi:hypothetical protein
MNYQLMKRSLYPLAAILFILITGIFNTAIAQKINNVQQASIAAPAGLKIDGKLNEWGTALQAYNKSTKLGYTLANDDQAIYLAIKSTDAANINKILAGGISFTINTAGKKKDKDAFVITYPVITQSGGRGMGRGRRGSGQDAPDSVEILAQHKQALAACKVISAIGFKDITDTLISIYNEYSIKAAANFDDKGNFIYELAIPFKMLLLSAGNPTEIAYQIKVNGMQMGGGMGMVKVNGGGGGGVRISGNGGGGGGFGGFSGRDDSDANDMMTPTDFWGKYMLAPSTKPPTN